jgi:WD40 repeat protein
LATGKQRRIVWKSVLLCSSALSHDGRLIASASILNDGRCDVGVRDVAEGKQLASLTVSTYQVRSLAFSSDAKLLAIVCQNTVLLWDWQSDKTPRILESRPAVNAAAARSYGGVAFAADTSQLAVVDGDRIRIWDLQTGQVRTECREAGPSAEPRAFTPDGRRLLTMGWTLAGQGFVKLWDTTSGREVFSAALPPVRLAATALSADGRRLAAAMVPLDSSVGTADRPLPAEIYVWDATPLATD